jgi:hypothetical protein
VFLLQHISSLLMSNLILRFLLQHAKDMTLIDWFLLDRKLFSYQVTSKYSYGYSASLHNKIFFNVTPKYIIFSYVMKVKKRANIFTIYLKYKRLPEETLDIIIWLPHKKDERLIKGLKYLLSVERCNFSVQSETKFALKLSSRSAKAKIPFQFF